MQPLRLPDDFRSLRFLNFEILSNELTILLLDIKEKERSAKIQHEGTVYFSFSILNMKLVRVFKEKSII